MMESRNGRCIPLRTIAARPPRWKAGGTRKGTKAGPKFSSPHTEKRAIVKEAKALRNKWSAAIKAQKRHLGNLAKGLFTDEVGHNDIEVRECECPPRVIDSLTLEDHLQLQGDLQALSVQDRHHGMLRYAADQQQQLNTYCSPTPKLTSEGGEDNLL